MSLSSGDASFNEDKNVIDHQSNHSLSYLLQRQQQQSKANLRRRGLAATSAASSGVSKVSFSDGSASLDLANIFYGGQSAVGTVDGSTMRGTTTSTYRSPVHNNDTTAGTGHPPRQGHDTFQDEDSFDGGGSSKGSSNDSNNNGGNKNTLAREETLNIGRLRLIVFGLLFLTTVLVSFVVYYNTLQEEQKKFERAFLLESTTVLKTIRVNLDSTMEAMDNMGISYTNTAVDNWPFVTLNEFWIRAQSTQRLGNVQLLSMIPIVADQDRNQWQSYAFAKSQEWIERANVFTAASETRDEGNRFLDDNKEQVDKVATANDDLPTPTPQQPSNNNAVPTKDSITKPPSQQQVFTLPPTPSQAPIRVPDNGESALFVNGVATTVYSFAPNGSGNDGRPIVETDQSQYFPLWQTVPTIPGLIQYNIHSDELYQQELNRVVANQTIVIGRTHVDTSDLLSQAMQLQQQATSNGNSLTMPRMSIMVPIFDQNVLQPTVITTSSWATEDAGTTTSASSLVPKKLVGILIALLQWQDLVYFDLQLHPETQMIMILETQCGPNISFRVRPESDGTTRLEYLGNSNEQQYHDDFQNLEQRMVLSNHEELFKSTSQIPYDSQYCPYTIRIYPSKVMQKAYLTNLPLIYTVAVVCTFLFTVCVFILYDILVERRQQLVMEKAVQSSAVVSSLFPAVVRDRLFPNGGSTGDLEVNVSAKKRLKTFLDEGSGHKTGSGGGGTRASGASRSSTKPIADLFPYTTVLFADIAGFTAWSSVREPSQVFTLLEAIYGAFDRIARKRTVFKVETIGDCYVAVTGLPDPQDDHAVIMAKFAYECLIKMQDLVESLEVKLGPDTGDLSMRLGCHSGPVTAGVLRGEKSRFQLFGDTVNTAARMESTGKVGRIQCSQATAELLIAGNKTHWVCPRDEIVQAKGKGKIQTYWINLSKAHDSPLGDSMGSLGSLSTSNFSRKSFATSVRDVSRSLVWGEGHTSNFQELSEPSESHKHQRLIDWNVEILSKLLKQILAKKRRESKHRGPESYRQLVNNTNSNPIHEVSEAIVMPEFDPKVLKGSVSAENVELSYTVVFQLKQYVTEIACHYRDDNSFHNFEHASHVTMSANKLLKRVVAPDHVYDRKHSMRKIASTLHNYTYGITSDPLTQFAIVFSALIHDVDHHGVSNMQLAKEQTYAAKQYDNKSIAEQNSVDISWDLLMQDDYKDLQKCIYSNEKEFRRFRSLVVNSVIATDIFDKDLKSFRNARWDKAFHQGHNDTNLMATIVIEHIIQAADVSHTMQHWHIYTKWNERLFHEMYSAFRSGRGGEKDPSHGWYKGELWFYDNYVLPLAKKLKECNVFGVASAECLNYAIENRREWEAKGEKMVETMLKAYQAGHYANGQMPDDFNGSGNISSAMSSKS